MKSTHFFLVTAFSLLLPALSATAAVTVMPVPWDPTNFASPHTVITGVSALLTATVNLGGSTDTFSYSWNFGDGSAATAPITIVTTGTGATVGNIYNLSVSHIYSAVAAGTPFTAVITVTDVTTTTVAASGNYPVVVETNTLQSRVNQAIDNGLWYLHTAMDRANTTNAATPPVTVPWGSWTGQLGNGCLAGGYVCLDAGGLDATNIQSYEVSGHLANGPAADPYTEDVARGLARVMYYLEPETITLAGPKTIDYNPALMNARCSDGTQPNYTLQTCATGTYINYNPTATTCTTAPATACTFTFDANSNGQILIEYNDGVGDAGYQNGMMVTALVAANNPTAVATTGVGPSGGLPGVFGQTYQNIIQDLVDGIGYCQYYGDAQNSEGYDNGGGWEYYCAGTASDGGYYDDNSPSQWNAIALIAANRASSIPVPQVVLDTNQVWVTWSECTGSSCTASDLTIGQFGYNEWNNPIWGPFAVTPSGMVQLAMDGVGRSESGSNKVANDNRWDIAETYYHDNFCNSSNGSIGSPKLYTYGLFSFTKSMEQHDPGGILSPIALLYDEPGDTGTAIDWYGGLSAANGGTAPCDGVAQTLVARQTNTADATYGSWFGTNGNAGIPVDYSGDQYYFETAWSVIMLQKTSFAAAACPAALSGSAKAGGRSGGPLINLTYNLYPNAVSYLVLRAPSSTGPFVAVASTKGEPNPIAALTFNDQTSGLVNGGTYYYEIQPQNSNAVGICTTANPLSITVP